MLVHYQLALELTLIVSLFQFSNADTSVNRTIDSRLGDPITGVQPIYNGPWNNASCPTCLHNSSAQTAAFDQGYHEAHSSPSATASVSMVFNGTALYVYCLVPNVNHGTTYKSVFDVVLDNDPVYRYNHTSDGTTSLDSTIIYSNNSLQNQPHKLALQLVDGVLLFDYIQYTTALDDTPTTPSNPTPTPPSATGAKSKAGTIAGGVIAGIVVLFSIPVLLFALHRRRRRNRPRRIAQINSNHHANTAHRENVARFLSSSASIPVVHPNTPDLPPLVFNHTAVHRHNLAIELEDREQQLATLQRSVTSDESEAREEVLDELNHLGDEISRLRRQQREITREMRPPLGVVNPD